MRLNVPLLDNRSGHIKPFSSEYHCDEKNEMMIKHDTSEARLIWRKIRSSGHLDLCISYVMRERTLEKIFHYIP